MIMTAPEPVQKEDKRRLVSSRLGKVKPALTASFYAHPEFRVQQYATGDPDL